ncbi:hypothetical protein AB4Y45_34690 [Paraburkholderia sp. EG287A]
MLHIVLPRAFVAAAMVLFGLASLKPRAAPVVLAVVLVVAAAWCR